ncbi:MAG: TetR/AcrR family transcriptional regulator [Chloroflexota bacterium]
MPINPDDPRVRKTRRGLRRAFIQLMLTKGYDAVTIQDIADAAETARITFYRHYPDKESLLSDCLNTLYEDLIQRTERVSAEGVLRGYTPVRVLYDHMEDEEQMYRVLFSSRGAQTVIQRLRDHLAANALNNIRNSVDTTRVKAPLDLIANHAASAQIGLAVWWLEHNKPYPADYMAQAAFAISFGGIASALGITPVDLPFPSMPDS